MISQAGAEMKRPPAAEDAATPASAATDDRGPRPGRRSARAGRSRGRRCGGLPQPGDQPVPEATSGPDGRFFCGPPWRTQLLLDGSRGDVPWIVASAPGFGPGWAVGRPRARRVGRGDDPAGRRRPADRGTDRRPRGPTRRRRPGQGRSPLVRQGRRPGGAGSTAGPGPWRPRTPGRASTAVAGSIAAAHRPRRPIPPGGHRPRSDRRAAHLGADDRHGPALCDLTSDGPAVRIADPPGDGREQPDRLPRPAGSSTPPRRPSRSRA